MQDIAFTSRKISRSLHLKYRKRAIQRRKENKLNSVRTDAGPTRERERETQKGNLSTLCLFPTRGRLSRSPHTVRVRVIREDVDPSSSSGMYRSGIAGRWEILSFRVNRDGNVGETPKRARDRMSVEGAKGHP
ncbi:hypothetical protein CDAR_305691 [Caerostris darwini]|uniref:Uncharacterized protein n=1 Tax=Caerostris darwini TaxID=1538125 RepID=A0AAV4VSU4_9ARAC|nr:hypothetical protein CDAR_305691 [Caerostris darwini]